MCGLPNARDAREIEQDVDAGVLVRRQGGAASGTVAGGARGLECLEVAPGEIGWQVADLFTVRRDGDGRQVEAVPRLGSESDGKLRRQPLDPLEKSGASRNGNVRDGRDRHAHIMTYRSTHFGYATTRSDQTTFSITGLHSLNCGKNLPQPNSSFWGGA